MMTEDQRLPAKAVRLRYGVCDRTLDRWLKNPTLQFPKPLVINGRRYWQRDALADWEQSKIKTAAVG